jgi:acyl-CoA thioester hydrolase
MPRPDPALLDQARYPFRTVLDPRFSDLDINSHLNNVAIMEIFQEARVRLHTSYAGLPDSRPYALIVASFSVDFLADGGYPDPITVAVGITEVGRTSHTVRSLMLQNGAPVAFQTSVMVRTIKGQPIENDPAFREAMAPWLMAT